MKYSMICVMFFVAVLCLTHVFCHSECPSAVPTQFSKVKPGKIAAAYCAGWDKYSNYKVSEIELVAPYLTHIIYAFAIPNATTGLCNLLDPWADVGVNGTPKVIVGGHFGQLLQIKQKFPHLKVLLSIGGGKHSKAFIKILKSQNIQKFVDSAMKLLDEYTYECMSAEFNASSNQVLVYPTLFDGVDLDIEWPNASAIDSDLVKAYHDLNACFYKALKKRGKRFGKNGIITNAIQANSKVIEQLQLESMSKYVDWFNVMAYDFAGSLASGVSLNAPICNPWSKLSIDNTINAFLNNGVSPAKLVLGIPLYGYVFDKAHEKIGSSFEKTSKTGPRSYRHIANKYVNNSECHTKRIDVAQAPFTYCPTEQVFASFDDAQSIQAKIEYARFKLLKGTVFWRLSGDQPDYSLIKSVLPRVK